MFKKFHFLEIDQNSNFLARIFVLSVPSAIVLLLLAVSNFLSPLLAIFSYGVIIIFNMILILPISFELQKLKNYIMTLGQEESNQDIVLSEKEVKEIAKAAKSMHQNFRAEADALKAKAVSDTAVLDTLPDPILMIERSGSVLEANSSAKALFGKSVITKNVEEIFKSQSMDEAVKKIIKGTSDLESLAFYIAEPVNKKLYAHIKKLPWSPISRAFAVISLYDLTKAIKLEKMQSDFVANASHELRTPLAVISGFIETLQTSAKDDENAREQFLKIMASQASFMSDLIENLLSLSRIELSQSEPLQDKIDVIKVVEEVSNALKLKASYQNMKIVVEAPEKISKIVADGGQIKQLIQNLTDNAIKYGLKNSNVTISIKVADKIPASKSMHVSRGKAVVVSINNKGPKIDAEKLSRLTERFYRLQEHKDLGIKGTGLGLSIAKQIVMHHRGNITVSSTNRNGTTFSVYLPFNPK